MSGAGVVGAACNIKEKKIMKDGSQKWLMSWRCRHFCLCHWWRQRWRAQLVENFEVDVLGTVRGIEAVLPLMEETGG